MSGTPSGQDNSFATTASLDTSVQIPIIRVDPPPEDAYDEQHELDILEVEQEIAAEALAIPPVTGTKARTKGKKARKSKSTNRRTPTVRRKQTDQQEEEKEDLLRDLNLSIYDWPDPQPKPKLLPFHKEWKVLQDQREAIDDTDEDLDDWYEKSGRPEYYSEDVNMQAFYYSIARSFILRAKRAFRAGKSWFDFETAELTLDSMAKASAWSDTQRRERQMRHALDNDVRLAVFEQIKVRLCEEIWLENYEEHGISLPDGSIKTEPAD